MDIYLPEQSPEISFTTRGNAPKRRTIRMCANVMSVYGAVVDYEKHSNSKFSFSLDIKRDKITPLLDTLRQMVFLDGSANSNEISVDNLPYRTPSRVNISLTFH